VRKKLTIVVESKKAILKQLFVMVLDHLPSVIWQNSAACTEAAPVYTS